MAIGKYVDVFEAYDRFVNGQKMTEQEWDYTVVPRNAKMLKESYTTTLLQF